MKKLFFITFLCALFLLQASAQSTFNPIIELTDQLQSLSKNAPQELVYIQTSKDIYETSEDLWFKAYVLNSQYLTPSNLSKTLYLQLLRESDKKPFWQEKYEIEDGFADGHVYLESSLSEGNYLLAAYTSNSYFDDSSDFKAVRKIEVRTDMDKKPKVIARFDNFRNNPVQFTTFPEGGNLVSGIKSKVAFNSVNSSGEPVDVKGTLLEDGAPLLEFASIHAGMGSFDLVPDIGKKYSILLSEPSVDSPYFLPVIYPTGIVMRLVEVDENSINLVIAQNSELKQDVYLRVQCRGVVCGFTKAVLNKELRIKIPLKELPQGIAEITLFNSSLIPEAERLVYINQNKQLNISAELSDEIYPTRGKANLKITVKDENGQPVVANLAVSIFDKLYQNHGDSSNILVYSYLSTQLKGRIYDPAYYFNGSNKDREVALDLLMLTQGWRRYVWNERELDKYKEAPLQIVFDGIKGELATPSVRKNTKEELKSVMVFSPEIDTNNVFIVADQSGSFTIDPDLLKSWKGSFIYMKPLGPPRTNPTIKLTDPFEDINLAMKHNDIIWPVPDMLNSMDEVSKIFETNSGQTMIDEIIIRGDNKSMIRGKYVGLLDSLARIHFDEDYVCRFGVLNCGKHPRNEEGTTNPVVGRVYNIYLSDGTYGKIRYSLPSINLSEEELLKINNLLRIKSYYGNREFYQPNYEKQSEEDVIPDYRNTLLWAPSVITDEKGEANLSFYCSDIYTDFTGRIEGVSNLGLLGTGSFKLTVRKLSQNP